MTNFLSLTTRLKVSPQVLSQDMGDETVLLHLERGEYFGLDAVGARFWQLLAEGVDPEAIVRVLLEEYEVAEEQLRNDLNDLAGELAETGLITIEARDEAERRTP